MPARDALIRFDLASTAVFGITAGYAAASFTTTAQWVGAVTAMVLFTVGVFAFLWSYWSAVQRSRTDEIAVSQLYLLLGPAIPRPVRRTLNAALLGQLAIALATTLLRPNGPDGNPGSSLAVGFLVPMLGFGLNGLWAVRHGRFEPRPQTRASDRQQRPAEAAEVPAEGPSIGQNADHG